jgi:hypothetical protein
MNRQYILLNYLHDILVKKIHFDKIERLMIKSRL